MLNAYHRLLKTVGLPHTISFYLQRSHVQEPLAWLLCSGTLGVALGWTRSWDTLWKLSLGLAIGLLLGHLLWGKRITNHTNHNSEEII